MLNTDAGVCVTSSASWRQEYTHTVVWPAGGGVREVEGEGEGGWGDGGAPCEPSREKSRVRAVFTPLS